MNIGFVGLGIMGSRMAERLMRRGHRLVVHNRSEERAAPLLRAGANWADSPAEAAGVEVLFTMLAHPDAVRQSALGDRGFLGALRPGSTWVDSSTVDPAFSREMAGEAAARGVRFVDAPVAGSKGQAEAGSLVFFAGGPAEVVEAVTPLLQAMGSRVVHAGAHGDGSSVKLVVNHLLGVSMAAFAEALTLGESLGLQQEPLLNVLLGSPVAAPFLALKREKIELGEYPAEFPLRWMLKDLHLVTRAAGEGGAVVPLAGAAAELYRHAVRNGLGDEDFSAVHALARGQFRG